MRRRIAFVAMAATLLVVLAFVIPLALLVRTQAEDRALSGRSADSQAVAAALAVAGSLRPDQPVDVNLAEAVIGAAGDLERTSVFLASGEVAGVPAAATDNVARARAGTAFTAFTDDGAEVLVPVLGSSGTAVVRTAVASADLRRGVTTSWLVLALLGSGLVVGATLLADRLARSVVRPVGALADAAHRLGGGDLDARVDPAGPPEVVEVGEAFNTLAWRLEDLLAAERESVADLSHRLRTPLTAIRLQAEALGDRADAAGILPEIDRLERGVSRIIADARRPGRHREGATADLVAVVAHRAEFWRVLAEEQDRSMTTDLPGGPVTVDIAADDLGAAVDTVLENVFAHTPSGAGFRVAVKVSGTGGTVAVADDGPGFISSDAAERGTSGSGSTGLGLDIVARAAERTGGGLRLGRTESGGALVEVTFGGPRSGAADAATEGA